MINNFDVFNSTLYSYINVLAVEKVINLLLALFKAPKRLLYGSLFYS